MKNLIVIFLSVHNFLYGLEYQEKEKVRYSFYSAIEFNDSMNVFKSHLKELLKKYPNSNFLLFYTGAYETLEAKHSWNVYDKFVKLKSGLKKISEIIINDPNNIEFRFIRFSILHYIPSFLGYDNLLREDLQKIVELLLNEQLNDISSNYKKGIIEFLFRSRRLDNYSRLQLNILYRELQ